MRNYLNSIKCRVNAADEFAAKVKPVISELREGGATLKQIADHLTENGIATARNCTWTPNAVRKVLERRLAA